MITIVYITSAVLVEQTQVEHFGAPQVSVQLAHVLPMHALVAVATTLNWLPENQQWSCLNASMLAC